ncbi:MAG: HAD family hydrolase [Brachybacterium tyrofermentans]
MSHGDDGIDPETSPGYLLKEASSAFWGLQRMTRSVTEHEQMRTLYVSDLDRTLLDGAGEVSVASAEMLNSAIEKGALFTYATARSFDSSRRATTRLRLNLPVITYGGTITADPDTGAPHDLHRLDPTVVDSVLAACSTSSTVEPVWITVEDGTDWIRWRPEAATAGTEAFVGARAGDRRLRPITAGDPLRAGCVVYVVIVAPRSELLQMRIVLAKPLALTAHFLSEDPATPGLDWLEFHDRSGTKAHALRRLVAAIGADRLIAFGDNHNDLPMFEVADESHAVSNAVPELKAIATSVIGHHTEDAVSSWIVAHQAGY